MAQKTPTKKKITPSGPTPSAENPSWLVAPPDNPLPAPPVKDSVNNLPLLSIRWDNFERLCRRLAEREGDVVKAWVFGAHGQNQLGIDILVRMKDGSFQAWQSKRHKKFGAKDVENTVEYFLKQDWAKRAKRFVIALACEVLDTAVITQIETSRTKLSRRGIALEVIGSTEITEKLRGEPEIVDDFFGRAWVQTACRQGAVKLLEDRVSRFDIDSVRHRLRAFYGTWIATVDPGLPVAGPDKDGKPIPAPALSKRYVLPNFVLNVARGEQDVDRASERRAMQSDELSPALEMEGGGVAKANRNAMPQQRQRTISAEELLNTEKQTIITADAGAGKTTFLRFLALELLSDESAISAIHQRFAGFIPLWIPFAMWTRMAEGKDIPPSLADVVYAFIAAQSDLALAADMKRVLESQKIILLVDGIDEAQNGPAADAVVVGLTTFVERNNVPVIATSRPHGLRALGGTGGNWTRVQLAPLSDPQKEALSLLWYRILQRSELGESAATETVEADAKRRATAFIAALARSPGIMRLSQTPLFLVALLKLHRLDRDLPRNRFDASKEIVDQLVVQQPRRRAKDAVDTSRPPIDPRLRDRLIDDFAYGLHSGALHGPVADGAAIGDAISRAALIVMARTGNTDLDAAESVARAVFSFGEESAGLLVKKAHDSIGFLHRSLQEYVVARKLQQMPSAERLEFVSAHSTLETWSEPILYLLYLVTNEPEVGQLLEVIEQAPTTGVSQAAIRDDLLTKAVFADFAHEPAIVRRIASKLFRETELFAWGARETQLLSSVTDGLFSQSLSVQCTDKIREWVPDRHGYGKASAIEAMPGWDVATRPSCCAVLLRSIACDPLYVSKTAAETFAVLADKSDEAKQSLLELVRCPRSIDALNASLASLRHGWSDDPDVAAIALALRSCGDSGVELEALRIRAARGDADLSDLEIFCPIAFENDRFSSDLIAPDLIEYFAAKYRAELTAQLETAFGKASRRHDDISLIGNLLLVDPSHDLIAPKLTEILRNDWSFREVFTESKFPAQCVLWTPEMMSLIEARVAGEKFFEYETYWIAKIHPLPSVKAKMFASLQKREHLSFWSAQGLAEIWGKTDPDVEKLFTSLLVAPSENVAQLAEHLPKIVDDKSACRAAILRALRDKPKRADFLVAGMKQVVAADDDEAFDACYEAGSISKNSLYEHSWRKELITAFPTRPNVRALALIELNRRDGNISAVAEQYGYDNEMCSRVLKRMGALPQAARLTLVGQLELASASNDLGFDLLDQSRFDTDGTVCGESILAWANASESNGTFDKSKIEYLSGELHAVGPEYEHRRAAAVIGLGLAGELSEFANLLNHEGKKETISLGRVSMRDSDDRYLRRFLPLWNCFSEALGGEAEVVRRLDLYAETCVGCLNPGVANADTLLKIFQAEIPTARHVRDADHVGLLARFAPESDAMRDLVMSVILPDDTAEFYRSNVDVWAGMMAAEIFAEHFADVPGLMQKVTDRFALNPEEPFAAAAMAEVALRRNSPEFEEFIRSKVSGHGYNTATRFKLMAAISSGDIIIDEIGSTLASVSTESSFFNCSYWVPAILKRIDQDEKLADAMIEAVATATSASVRLSLLALVGRSSRGRTKFRSVISQYADVLASEVAPTLGFDVTSSAVRLGRHVLYELAV